MRARRALFPLPIVDRPQVIDASVFPTFERRPVRVLEGRRAALIAAEQGVQIEFANRLRAALGSRLTIIYAADHRLLRGPVFYDLFIDRSRWPELIRDGYERATRALDAFRRAPRVAAAKSRTVGASSPAEH